MKRFWYAIAILGLAFGAGAQQPQRNTDIDVPPIQEEYGEPGRSYCDMGQCVWMPDSQQMPSTLMTPGKRRTRWTCADKTRFLMKAEDESYHCLAIVNATSTVR